MSVQLKPVTAKAVDMTHGSVERASMAMASRSLLIRLLRYGIRHDTHLGLGVARFRAACRDHGIVFAAGMVR
jgi:hypothetical protein